MGPNSELPVYKLMILAGVLLVLAGLILWLAPGRLHWIGRLPGDIRIERENFRFYMPITTMVLLSIALSVFLRLLRRFL